MRIRVRNINRVTHRGPDGRRRIYLYHRKTRERLPDDPMAAAVRARDIDAQIAARSAAIAPRSLPGTFADLIGRYLASIEFAQLAPETRRGRARHVDQIRAAWGDLPVRALDEKSVKKLRDNKAHAPRQSNQRLSALSVLLDFGKIADPALFGRVNPARSFPRLRERPHGAPESWPPWPDELIAVALEAAYPELAWNLMLRLCTGQRGGDCHAMLWEAYTGGPGDLTGDILVRQDKTGKGLVIPAHPALRAVLDHAIPDALGAMGLTAPAHPKRPILMTKRGKRWTGNWSRREIAALLEKCGADPGRYVGHGLRKNATCWLLEAGASPAQVAAVTGNSRRMVDHYAAGVSQARLAQDAIKLLVADEKRTKILGVLQNARRATAKQRQNS